MILRDALTPLAFTLALAPIGCGSNDSVESDTTDGDAVADADGAEGDASGSGRDGEIAESRAPDVADGSARDDIELDGPTDASDAPDASEPIDASDGGSLDAREEHRGDGGDEGAIDAHDERGADAGEEGSADAPDELAMDGTSAGPTEIAYIATYLGGIAALSIDSATGALSPVPGSPFDSGAGFYAIGVAPSAGLVYAADFRNADIAGYRIRQNGSLERLPDFPFDDGGEPIALAVDPQERFVYVGNFEETKVYVYAINRATGALTAVADSPFSTGHVPAILAADPSGRFLYMSSQGGFGIHGFAIDGSSGKLEEMRDSPFGTTTVFGGGLAFVPAARLLYTGGNGIHAFRYDDTSGVLTELLPGDPLGPARSDDTAGDIATDSDGQHLYAVSTPMNILSAYDIDRTSGALTPIAHSPFDATPFPYSVGVDPSGRFVYVGNDDVNQITGFAADFAGDGLRHMDHSPFDVVGLQPEFAFVRLGDQP